MKKVFVFAIAIAVATVGFGYSAQITHAEPFLCPVVGDGVLNADAHNGDHGVSSVTPPVGTSFLPGKNQAGAHANENALNTENPSNPDAGPGANPDFSPIWPG